MFLLDFFSNLKVFNRFILYKLFFYFFSLYLNRFFFYFFLINLNFLKFFFLLIKFFFLELCFFSRFVILINITYLKFRYFENVSSLCIVKNFIKNNFFYKKNYFFLLEYFFKLFSFRYYSGIKNSINLNFLESFFYYVLRDYNRFLYLFFNIIDIFKLYNIKKKFLRFTYFMKGRYFSKFFRKWKFIKFATVPFWKNFNKFILNNAFKRTPNKYYFMNSFLILKYFTSYFNFKNYRSFFFCKKLITKKVKFRLRNFFFFLNYVFLIY